MGGGETKRSDKVRIQRRKKGRRVEREGDGEDSGEREKKERRMLA